LGARVRGLVVFTACENSTIALTSSQIETGLCACGASGYVGKRSLHRFEPAKRWQRF
jgi:hypothetical protein